MFQTVEAAPGVYAFIAAPTSGPIPSGNVVAIVGDDGVLVVDSGRFPTLAKRMIAEIRAKTDKPVRYLVHTHWHLDHIAADEVFRQAFPGMAIVTTDFTRRKIAEKQVPYLKDLVETDRGYVEYLEGAVAKGKRRDGSAMSEESKRYLSSQVGDIQLESAELAGVAAGIPDLTFDHELRIHLGKREVRIAFLGKGNTAGDTVVFVPDAKVAVTGDLLVSPTPYGYGCHPSAWSATLDALMASGATVIVPGTVRSCTTGASEEGLGAAGRGPPARRRAGEAGRYARAYPGARGPLGPEEALRRRQLRAGRRVRRLFRPLGSGPRLPGGEGGDGGRIRKDPRA
jgi:glyoxylase-like metal-dependent hydrolase (beta-lactamase superfamily II)